MSGHALPRLLVRTRRRKPRGPAWKRAFVWLCLWLILLAYSLIFGFLLTAAGDALFAVAAYWALGWWPANPEGAEPTLGQLRAQIWVARCGFVLVVLGIFA